MNDFFNAESIKSIRAGSKFAPAGFRYGFVSDLFDERIYRRLIDSFPDVKSFKLVDKQSGGGRKRFYVGPNYFSGRERGCICNLDTLPKVWRDLLFELASDRFISLLSGATGIKFNSLGDFGLTYGNEGCVQEPHLDGAVRPGDPNEVRPTIALLLYFNEKKGGSSGTCIYDNDRKTVLAQAPDLRNSMFFFEQHPNSWHGFPLVRAGEDRRLVSLSYSLEKEPIKLKNSLIHKITCLSRLRRAAKKILR